MTDALWGVNPETLVCECSKGAACTSPGKHPGPGANRRVCTDGDLFVVDLDRKQGKDGIASLRELTARHGALPRTRTVRTGSGGLHLYFHRPDGMRVSNSAGKLGLGIDVRGDGGFVVAPGSLHVSGKRYSVEVDAPIALAPPWLLELVAGTRAENSNAERSFPSASPEVLDEARVALERHGPAVQGAGGDAHTFVAAAILTHDFALREDLAWPLFAEWNETCQPPWAAPELRAKLRGGAKYGNGPFGSKRGGDVEAQLRALISNSADPARLVEAARPLFARVSDPTRYALLAGELKMATGLKFRELGLPRLVDREAVARREALELGDPGLIDSRAPFDTARQFLAQGRDAEGLAELVRWQDEFWRAMGSHYAPLGAEVVRQRLYGFLDGKRDVQNNTPVRPDRNQVEEIEHALRAAALLDLPAPPAWLGAKRELAAGDIIAFPNGLLHVPTRAFIPATRAFFGLNAVSFDFDASAARPAAWHEFLTQLWGDDLESIETLGEIFGLALTGDTSFQKLFLLIGPKRSGKGTLARVLTELVGVGNCAAPTLNGLGQHFGLQSLIGKLMAIISDARLGARADADAVTENLLRISGEDTISVPRKHRTDWTAKLQTRFLIISNELPRLLDQSGALASRFVVLQLTRSFFGQEDRALTQKLLSELPGILLWSLDGLERLRRRGHFRQPTSALETVKQLETLASPIKAFVGECCELAPGGVVSVDDLFNAWRRWAAEQGRDQAGTKQMFGKHLAAAFPEVRTARPRTSGGRERVYEGLRLVGPDGPHWSAS